MYQYGYGDEVTLVWAEEKSEHSKAVVLGFPTEIKDGIVPRIKLGTAKGSAVHYGVRGRKWLFVGPHGACHTARRQDSTRGIDISAE